MAYIIGIDIGGTCTDCVVVNENGKVTLGKAFSTPPDFSEGIFNAIQVLAEELNTNVKELLGNTKFFLHSTTVAENAVVDGTLAKGGLLTTRGFEETLFAMRGGYGRWSGLTEEEKRNPIETDKLPPVIPITMIKGVKERTDYKGEILCDVDKESVVEQIKQLVNNGAESIGISFLWSLQNATNEETVKAIVKELYPDMYVTASNEIAPILGEYERTSTVALNISLGPLVTNYLTNLRNKLGNHGFNGTLLVMQAYGGLLPLEEAAARPVAMIESGPVSGLVGSKRLGEMIDCENIIVTDMGGTTFKAGIVRDGFIEYQREPMVLRYHYSLPKMDVVSIGLAGGSIISLDKRTGLPHIGPNSAGSYPGPVCYDFGGTEPTITDVDLILGYLDPRFYLGGRADLNKDKAIKVFKEKIADPLNMEVVEAAGAMYKLATSMIYDLLHKTTVERGLDPRRFALFASGGNGGMHVAAYAEELGVSKIVIPYSASVNGAFGVATSDIVHEEQITHPLKLPVNPEQINEIYDQLHTKVMKELEAGGFDRSNITISRSIDMRYRRQVHIVTTPVTTSSAFTEQSIDDVCNYFEELYTGKYGKDSAYKQAGVEMVSFRLRGTGILNKPEITPQKLEGKDPEAALVELRQVYFEKAGGLIETRAYDFQKLRSGNVIQGPAVVWTPITTIVVHPGQQVFCDQYKNMIITNN